MNTPISNFMTSAPHTIGKDASLATARTFMNEHRIRHLPVLDGGVLVGLVSIRDIELLETLEDVRSEDVAVEEAMSTEVLTFDPQTPLTLVVRKMAERKAGSAIIAHAGRVVGIFTTVDALYVLAEALGPEGAASAQ